MKDVSALEHVVVIMFENRSFDNIFGYLHPPATCRRDRNLKASRAAHTGPCDQMARHSMPTSTRATIIKR
ncbi:alkaline phosphatase family protein [Xanthobacter sp. NFH-44]|uniref:alkaline phosphatase family protein n=1 Tax=unclassified Xanthobacter TaxID=2623496 RepID=UPI00351D8DA5